MLGISRATLYRKLKRYNISGSAALRIVEPHPAVSDQVASVGRRVLALGRHVIFNRRRPCRAVYVDRATAVRILRVGNAFGASAKHQTGKLVLRGLRPARDLIIELLPLRGAVVRTAVAAAASHYRLRVRAGG